jgi:UDP-N-acetylglucosamine--N-acetylmuramyl-(pentapeptide) pyrophosphoryl-undecaprenol N-acetylglucosamine transferase
MPNDSVPAAAKTRWVVFAGGGTGGHIFPGLAVADSFRALNPSVRVAWFGSSRGMDKSLVEASGKADAFYGIPSGKLRRYFSLQTIPDCAKIMAGFFKAFFLLAKLKPAALFSKGGYVSVPSCYAATLLGIPVFTHECDFSPGLATRLNARAASLVFVSYADTADFFNGGVKARVILTGNPVREEFYHASALLGRQFLGMEQHAARESKPLLVVLGGSSGSRQLNDLVSATLPWLTRRFNVVHQTGFAAPQGQTEKSGDPPKQDSAIEGYKAYAFIHTQMCHVIAAADVIAARAGANTLWECAVCAKPLVLIPLSGAGTRGDQVENAAFFARNNAAIALDGDTVTQREFTAALETMLDSQKRYMFSRNIARLTENASAGGRPARVIAELINGHIKASLNAGAFCGTRNVNA